MVSRGANVSPAQRTRFAPLGKARQACRPPRRQPAGREETSWLALPPVAQWHRPGEFWGKRAMLTPVQRERNVPSPERPEGRLMSTPLFVLLAAGALLTAEPPQEKPPKDS